MVIVYGLFAMFGSFIITLVYKYMFENIKMEKKQARLVTLADLFIYGLTGTLCLIISTCLGHGLFEMSLSTILMVIIAGICLHTGLSLYIMSIA